MKEVTTTRDEAIRFSQDIFERIRGRLREGIEVAVEEELTELLAPGSWLLAPGSWLLAPGRRMVRAE